MNKLNFLLLVLLVLLTDACGKQNIKPVTVKHQGPTQTTACDCVNSSSNKPADITPVQLPESRPTSGSKPIDTPKIADYSLLKPAKWDEIDGLNQDDLTQAWPAWIQGCSTLINTPAWKSACTAANSVKGTSNYAINIYYKKYFTPYLTNNADGTDTGLITGYYEPLLNGSRHQSVQTPYPLYSLPTDLVTVELADIYPDLKFKRVRGKLVGNKVLPYYTRAEIEAVPSPLQGHELMWIDDIIDVFFLQIQGSGLVQLENGEQVHVGYADQNGYTYNSIGRLLVERGELTLDQASMQGIKNWTRNNLDKLRDLLNSNPSYVFFRELPANLPGPIGALGVPIIAQRVVAIDPKYIPLGAPVFLSTNQPNSTAPLKRLMMAQDTGGAIKGGVRADFFWGAGNEAGKQAGAMKQKGKIWVLLPKEFVFK
ncbi:MAG: murein transglycosylase A [Methylophilaceae bacterium]|nr:murein transglycosylase A [Methylophilaceae bacterium]